MFESHHVSRHFERRREQTRRPSGRPTCGRVLQRLPKLSLAIHAASHLILVAHATTGSGTDQRLFAPLLTTAVTRWPLTAVVADAGFDSEANHQLAREELKLDSWIPATTGYPGIPRRPYRYLMWQQLGQAPQKQLYGQRWQVETVNSMVKRNLGSACRARTAWGRKKDLLLRAVTHNLMIIANL